MKAEETRRVAFFGGSFDPPHLGHLAVARAARTALRLDTILFAPVGAQPLKPQGSTASFDDRLRMTELAIQGDPGFALSRIDAPDADGRPNYTLDTLRRLRAELPARAELFCLMGADSFLTLHHWHEPAQIPFAAALIVASRPGQHIEDLESALPSGITMVDRAEPSRAQISGVELVTFTLRNPAGRTAPFHLLPGLDVAISASEIRQRIRGEAHAGAQRELICPAVECYIRERGLYR